MKLLLLWEAFLTFFTTVSAGIGLVDVVPGKDAALMVLMAQGLNFATIVYKTGQWNPNPGAVQASPVVVVQGQEQQPRQSV